ncbi:DUF1905 domain-containing protein [Novosphingobium resinovorum]|uniref:DUF1905 domain-containing protein n=1 Tax=Novosphingobium TaxID=165696 RepID=UPI001B3C50CB|nr:MULTISPECIES: DUF1905 domain-containing protein [Novosphingobium]MBF7010323.1 DUF1905 domain-containing protein [Novosphingobium sp. HR1a]WJM28329.1 DUF1905 domain-containing protein [Novosphingobium resinovorum]
MSAHGEHLQHTGRLWRWTGGANNGTWHFLTIDGAAGEALSGTAIMRKLEGTARGFGSLKVNARIGGTDFATSVFPSKSDGGWLLPVKAAVRKTEGIGEGDEVEVSLTF